MAKTTSFSASNMLTPKRALYFVILLGIVSLFADMTYEGARSITGPYLAQLGASAAIVGFVAGLGEFIGYSLRWFSGRLVDRTRQYWLITFCGYIVNLLAVPLLALTSHWPSAAALIVLERFGKSIRIPARDAMLSYGSQTLGMGFGFGLHEALDQIGAMLGPLIIALVMFFKNDYQIGFAVLAVPAFLALVMLFLAYRDFPHPQDLEVKTIDLSHYVTSHTFWIYLIGCAFVAFGYADFPLIAYHFEKAQILSKVWIPITYGIAMGVNAIASPFMGWLYDRFGLVILILAIVISALFAPLVFLWGTVAAIIGVCIWAIGMGAQSSLMRAAVGKMIPPERRGTAYGVFNMFYGFSWFLGSTLLGIIYDHSITIAAGFVVILQLAAVPWLIVTMKQIRKIKAKNL